MPERIVIKGRPEDLEKAATEEAIERGEARSVVEEVEGRKVLRIRWITGKTSAGRLFGRYGKEGRPDFFRLLFGAIAGSLREQFGEEGEELFNKLRESREFKQSVSKLFEEMKNWFFNEIVPKYGIEPGDIFVITAEIEVDLETGRITWNKEKTSVIYWVRSDKLPEKCKELLGPGASAAAEEIEKLKKMLEEKDKEIEKLRKELEELKKKLKEGKETKKEKKVKEEEEEEEVEEEIEEELEEEEEE